MADTDSRDKAAIIELLYRFARLNDDHDYAAVVDLFTVDGVFIRPSDPDHRITGRDAIADMFRNRRHTGKREHLVANPEVELLSENEARAHCHSILIVADSETRGTVTVGGFRDRIVREDGTWHFALREGYTRIAPVPYEMKK